MNKYIYDKNFKIKISSNNLKEYIEGNIDLYKNVPNSEVKEEVYLEIGESRKNKLTEILKKNFYSISPKSHITYENGFIAMFGDNTINFSKEDTIKITLNIDPSKSYRRKFMNMGYRDNLEHSATILHELAIVPSSFFFKDIAILHASSMYSIQSNRTVLIGGTGGVGKTSLELMLCISCDWSFIADDIAIIDKDSNVYPNFSYPKIYAYNIEGNKNLKEIILSNSSIMSKVQWYALSTWKGKQRVRRSCSPVRLYGDVTSEKKQIDAYYIIHKTNKVKEIKFRQISSEMAMNLSLNVIENEYQEVFKHIKWHEYNCILMGFNPILKYQDIINNMSANYLSVFKNIKCYIVEVPYDIEHSVFLNQMRSILV
ncbi:hypothetical protein [Psychrobacter sp. I-STPA6b]|uniref:hypothetical protein n=1 Tax=Psychrobacter sp. I-STPA6b TaxID=2585718 RepID=UPI001D0C6CE1|nr:hypothetical protein [Psychrobacter sp. I-STPA6b]